jgi:hypothetical protein
MALLTVNDIRLHVANAVQQWLSKMSGTGRRKEMPEYLVTWSIDIEADSEEEAAKQAQEIQRDPESTATVFSVESDDSPVKLIDVRKL